MPNPRYNEAGYVVDDSAAIVTYLGLVVHPLAPSPDEIEIEDIAHALSNQCRFTGHVSQFYSIAQHSVAISELVPPKLALMGLLHDAAEAYLSDIASPIKHGTAREFGDIYRKVEEGLDKVIAEKFKLPWPWPPEIKTADKLMLRTEQWYLMPRLNNPVKPELASSHITGWEPWVAKENFLMRYAELTDEGFATRTKVFFKTKSGRDLHKFVTPKGG